MFLDTPAIVLKRTRMQENDLMVTLFTRRAGIMQAVAKGARNPKTQVSSCSQQFVFGNFNILLGDNYNYINSCEILFSFYKIRENIEVLAYASYFCELIIKTLKEGQISHDIFVLLVEILGLAESGDSDLAKLKVAFELKILKYTGFGIDLKNCANCGNGIKFDENIQFSPESGGALCKNCRHEASYSYNLGSVIPKLIVYMSEKDIRIINKTKINDLYLDKLDRIIKDHMRYQLDIGRMKTLEFLTEIKKIGVK